MGLLKQILANIEILTILWSRAQLEFISMDLYFVQSVLEEKLINIVHSRIRIMEMHRSPTFKKYFAYEELSKIPSIGAPHHLLNDQNLGMPITGDIYILLAIDSLKFICKGLAANLGPFAQL